MSEDRGTTTNRGRAEGGPEHVPVLFERTIELFRPVTDCERPVIVDGTLGLGGHTAGLLAKYPTLHVIGVDRDLAAHEQASLRLADFSDRFHPLHARFDDLDAIDDVLKRIEGPLDQGGRRELSGVLLDFGVSSMQLDQAERGFAYSVDAPLDMRMDTTTGPTAAEVLAEYPPKDLRRIFRDYGEERFADRVARAIVARRETDPIERSADLVELLYSTIPAAARRTGGHPAKRVFQALRIEVNSELQAVENATVRYLDRIRPGGRAVFMSYHSLEDRIVKREITRRTASRTPAGLPVELPGHGPEYAAVTRGAEKATETEIEANPRSASVRVRCVQKNDGSA